jgi:hypothetical protein
MNDAVVFLFAAFSAVSCLSIVLIIVTIPLAAHHHRAVRKAAKDKSVDGIYQTLTIGDLLVAPELQQPLRKWLQDQASLSLPAQVKNTEKNEDPRSKTAPQPARETPQTATEKYLEAPVPAPSDNREPGQANREQRYEGPGFRDEVPSERDQGTEDPGLESPG